MLAGAFGTLIAALIVIGAACAVGGGILAACGRRKWSWAAPAIGLAAITVLAWWAVRLPGEGVTALACVLIAAVLGGVIASRLGGLGEALRLGVPVVVLGLAAALVPFAVEGHFGVLGTGFNVDMSQHLFAADWIADPRGPAPGLYEQGYPLGPHALAVAAAEIGGEPATAFSGVTIAAPVLLALSAIGWCAGLGRPRAVGVALLTGFAYLVATYLAQGSFKELFAAVLLIGFALLLAETSRLPGAGWRAGIPFGILGAGALYAYSGPGVAWLVGTAALWAAIELVRRRGEAAALPARALPVAAVAIAATLILAAPEADRIIDFGGSVGTVSERAEAAPAVSAAQGESDAEAGDRRRGPEFDDDLGNLFGQISPLEALGVWPSGDFRVAPGDGAVPAFVFYLGALLGAACLALGVAGAWRRAETALLAALAAAAAIWLGALALSTPYTTAKALMMLAPVVMLVSARGLLDPAFLRPGREPGAVVATAFTAAFIASAALSSALALGNAPVGPREYTPGVFALSDRFAGRSVLLIVPDDVLADERGEEFYGWELREAGSFEIRPESAPEGDGRFNFVISVAKDGHVESSSIR